MPAKLARAAAWVAAAYERWLIEPTARALGLRAVERAYLRHQATQNAALADRLRRAGLDQAAADLEAVAELQRQRINHIGGAR